MRYFRGFLTAMAVIVSLTLFAYSQEASAPAASPEMKQDGHSHSTVKEKRFVAVIGADGVQHVEITGGDYFFDPNYIVVKANVPVELSAKKEKGYVPHDIVVKAAEAGIDFSVDLKDKPQVVRFTPTKPGKYEILCNKKLLFFKSHKDRGMHGVIEVVP